MQTCRHTLCIARRNEQAELSEPVSCRSDHLHQPFLYDPKVTVWSRGVIGPYIFENEDGQDITVTPQLYAQMINEFLAPKLPPNHNSRFQQDGATAHLAVISMPLFQQRVISRSGDVPWPLPSSDLTASEFFLRDYLESKVYSRRPVDLNALKEAIRDEIMNTARSHKHLLNSCALCIRDGSDHLQNTAHK